MNPITKAIVSNKFGSGLSSAEKGLGFGSDNNRDQTSTGAFSAKEIRKLEEDEADRRAKKQREHNKRSAEREKKREEIRAKYGLQKGNEGNDKRSKQVDERCPKKGDENSQDKGCCVM